MKKSVTLLMGLALLVGTFAFANRSAEANPEAETLSCPSGTITRTGCIELVDGCYSIVTVYGNRIYVNLSSFPGAGGGEKVTVSGFYVEDHDCAPCVLKVTALTDLGDCDF